MTTNPETKTCRACEKVLPLSHYHKDGPGRLKASCSDCTNDRARRNRKKYKAEPGVNYARFVAAGNVEKNCPGCDIVKPLEAFARNKHKADGLQWLCRSCVKTGRKGESKLQKALRMGALRAERAGNNVYRHSETQQRQSWAAMGIDAGSCFYCGVDLATIEDAEITIDHVLEIDANNGPHIGLNIVPACRSCNTRKSRAVRGGRKTPGVEPLKWAAERRGYREIACVEHRSYSLPTRIRRFLKRGKS
jgi:5-methylcytosine-specific restriction endonuclease McrA